MSAYESPHHWDRATSAMLESGASLEQLHAELQKVDRAHLPIDTTASALAACVESPYSTSGFLAIRLSELFDGAEVPHDETYVMAFVNSVSDLVTTPSRRAALLAADEELRENVFWRVFEIERVEAVSLASVDRVAPPNANWKRALVQMVDAGIVDRARVLRSCLEALNRDFSDFHAGWFSQAYAALEPTAAEAGADQRLLVDLLRSSTRASAALAAKQLAAVQKAGALETGDFLAAAPDALRGAKGTASAVVRILAATLRSAKKDPGIDADQVADVVAEALTHLDPAVQSAAAKVLVGAGRADLLAARAELLAASVASEYAAPLAAAGAAGPVQVRSAAPGPDPAPVSAPGPAALEPWTDADAAGRLAVLLARSEDLSEFELSWAWFASSPQRSTISARHEKRARTVATGVATASNVLPAMAVLSAVGAHDALTRCEARLGQVQKKRPFLPARVREVLAVVAAGDHRTLLATPTDVHGWIAPARLVERVVATADLAPLHHDVVAALLRLGLEGRSEALAALRASGVDGELAAALTYALGARTTHPPRAGVTSAWWVAAARARDPFGASDLAGLPRTGPGLDQPMRVRVEFEARGRGHTYAHLGGDEAPAPDDLPTVLPSGLAVPAVGIDAALSSGFAAWLHPPTTAPLVHLGIGPLKHATEGATPAVRQVLDLLADHPGAWASQTVVLLALGMSVSDAPTRIKAAEILLDAVPERIALTDAAAAFRATLPAATLTRWAASFEEAAAVSPHGEQVVTDLLIAIMGALDPSSRGIAALLAVLLEVALRRGARIDDEALRGWLGTVRSGAGAKTAKALLALD